ncbi:hypothetical protein CJF31_00011079 [Rutstroemia sp. NJR-2017a BVV2]|nr:hypothetical protein CJF31_00011079 [Rutstroemia sp. NJR-2017a BVV2]
MFAKAILLSALAATGLVQASPLKDLNEKRVCGTAVLPNGLFQLSQADPNTSPANTAPGGTVTISQAANDAKTELVTFAPLDATAYGCQLQITMPSAPAFSTTGGAPTLSIFKVKQPVSGAPTFANTQLESGIYGSITLQAGQSATINTEGCRGGTGQGLAYVFKYADWNTAASSVTWTQGTSVAAPVGVFLTHNC